MENLLKKNISYRITEFKATSLFTAKDFKVKEANSMSSVSGGQYINYMLANKNERESKSGREEISHKAFQPFLFVALSMGVMPLYGISGNNSKRLQFKWVSCRIFMATVMILFDLSLIGVTIFHRGINRASAGSLVFYSVTTMAMIFFIQLAHKWKKIIRKFTEVNIILGYEGHTMIKKLKLITFVMIFLSVGEHTLANMNSYYKDLKKDGSDLQIFFLNKFFFIFELTEYALWKGLILLAIHFQTTIVWNLIDIFIVSMATALSNMLQFYNSSIRVASLQRKPMEYWKKKRESYWALVSLIKDIEHQMSNLVLLSFGSNLFFICMQLYYNLTVSNQSIVKSLYFLISFGFLVMRTCLVCLSSSSIHESSNTTLDILFSMPASQFNLEVQRLLEIVRGETLAISGHNFFIVNRKLMLTVAGTIATYELVLVQFKSFHEHDEK